VEQEEEVEEDKTIDVIDVESVPDSPVESPTERRGKSSSRIVNSVPSDELESFDLSDVVDSDFVDPEDELSVSKHTERTHSGSGMEEWSDSMEKFLLQSLPDVKNAADISESTTQ
jgi:hypothetical protein